MEKPGIVLGFCPSCRDSLKKSHLVIVANCGVYLW